MNKILTILAISSILTFNIDAKANQELDKDSSQDLLINTEKKSSILTNSPWIRLPTPTSKNTAGYLTLYNNENIDIKIIEVLAPEIAEYTEIHGYKDDEGGIKRMYPLGAVTIPAGSSLVFKPGSTHVMFLNLKEKLSLSKNYNVTFKIVAADEKKYPDYQLNYSVTFPVKTRN